ncbi:MAG: hypothetical protein Q9161_001759 [Pseudevernia consocians]
MSSPLAVQFIDVPHRPIHSDEEINKDLAPALSILFKAHGLIAAWQGKRHEDRYTQIWILLWQDLASSHAFFTSPAYREFHNDIQPALNGRSIHWQQHALVGTSDLDSLDRLKAMVKAPAIEVALTKVIEGRVSGYYDVFRSTIGPILDGEDGCDGWWVGPQMENPQHQILLENWRSVDAHHDEFEKRPTFQECIVALSDYYGEYVIPTHIVHVKPIFGSF